MDVEEKFYVEKKLVCPKCHEELKKPDEGYRRAGVWCTCNNCSKSFDIPVPRHFCRDCHRIFLFEEAVFKEAYAYKLNKAVKTEFSEWATFAPIKHILKKRGFNVETPGFIEGRTGVKHMFDILAYKKKSSANMIAVDVAFSKNKEPVSDQPLIEMFAKKFDSAVNKAFLITIPRIVENGRKLADLYGVKVVEAETLEKALKSLETLL